MTKSERVLNRAEEMVAEARRRALEAHPERAGRPTRGPFAEMALDAGIDPAIVRRAVAIIGGTVAPEDDRLDIAGGFALMMGQESRDRFLRESAKAFAKRGLTT